MQEYDKLVNITKDQILEYPDFKVVYLGDREVFLPVAKRNFHMRDFKVITTKTEKVITWSPGTGLVSPVTFQIGNDIFSLDPKDSTMVISKNIKAYLKPVLI